MKVLILFDTKYGFTEKCAKYLHNKIPGSRICELQENFNVSEFDAIMLGSYIYLGEISEHAANFLKKYKNILLKKNLGIFCSALDKSDYLNALQKSLDVEIFYHAKIVLPGGQVKFSKLNFFEKRKLKKRINITTDIEEFYPDRLDELLELK
jgi:menaquinone-dependent protoporphyrinogen oxidase